MKWYRHQLLAWHFIARSLVPGLAAMILNGLGFIDSRLYLFPEFLSDKPIDRFMGF